MPWTESDPSRSLRQGDDVGLTLDGCLLRSLDTDPTWPDLTVVRNHVLGCDPWLNEDEADETTRFHHACRRHDGRLAARPRAQQRATHRESASSGLAIRGPLMNPGDGVNVAVRSNAGICCISDVILDRYTVTPTPGRRTTTPYSGSSRYAP
jgi:hypothetical protein